MLELLGETAKKKKKKKITEKDGKEEGGNNFSFYISYQQILC